MSVYSRSEVTEHNIPYTSANCQKHLDKHLSDNLGAVRNDDIEAYRIRNIGRNCAYANLLVYLNIFYPELVEQYGFKLQKVDYKNAHENDKVALKFRKFIEKDYSSCRVTANGLFSVARKLFGADIIKERDVTPPGRQAVSFDQFAYYYHYETPSCDKRHIFGSLVFISFIS